jgi:hypothetical protein
MENVMGVVKKNLVSIICGVIVIIAVAATFWPISGMFEGLQAKAQGRAGAYSQLRDLVTKERRLPVVSLKEGATGEPLTVFPTPAVIERGEKVKADIAAEAKAMFAEAVKLNQGDKKPLVPEALPEPPRGSRYNTVINNFQRAYSAEMDYTNPDPAVRNKSMPARELRKMGVVPTAEQIKAEQDRVTKIIQQTETQWDATNKPLNAPAVAKKVAEVTAAVPNAMRAAVSKESMIYLDPGALTVMEQLQPASRPQPAPPHLFWGQMTYWLQQDVLRAIAEANADASDVSASAVKRIVKLTMPEAITPQVPHGFTAPRAAAPTGGENLDGGGGEVASAVPTDPSQPIPPNYTISPTGRYSNALYDVIHFKLTLVVDAARVPLVIQALSKNRFMTVYNTNLTAVDAAAHADAGYYYGPSPVVQIEMDCEALYLRDWTKQYMPRQVRTALGIVDETATPPAQ